MPKLVWNGGFELDWKTIGGILAFVFIAGGNWIHYNDLKESFRKHVESAELRDKAILVQGYRLGTLETRLDHCCPWGPLPSTFTPKDIVPPEIGIRP